MSPRPRPAAASSHGSMGVDSGHPASPSTRLSEIIASCRRLATKFLKNPRWGVMFTFGRFRFVSAAVVFFHRSRLVRPTADGQCLFASLDVDAALANMRRDGLHTGINLTPETVAQITRFAYSTECYWPTDPSLRFFCNNRADAERRCGQSILLGRYFDIEDRCDAIRAIAQDPVLHYLAASYMGAPARQVEARLWWSFVGDATAAERIKADQGFHYDLHDYRSIALFFHVTDVDEDSGPHVHVKGSHIRKPLRLLLGDSRQSSDEDIVKLFGAENVMTLCGSAGFGFATDPFGYHKGAPPRRHDRLILRVRYTINDDGSRVDKSTPHTAMAAARPS